MFIRVQIIKFILCMQKDKQQEARTLAKKGKCHKNTIASFCAGDGAELAELHRNAIFVSNGCFACCCASPIPRDCCMRAC